MDSKKARLARKKYGRHVVSVDTQASLASLAVPRRATAMTLGDCACTEDHLPRRRFLRYLAMASTTAAAAVGGLVGFQPTAWAAVRCDAQPAQRKGCGINYRPCFGVCSTTESCCDHGTGRYDYACCYCGLFCRPAQVVVYASGKSCYFCCRYC